MATKNAGPKKSTGSNKRSTPRTGRKTVRKTSAPLARKGEDDKSAKAGNKESEQTDDKAPKSAVAGSPSKEPAEKGADVSPAPVPRPAPPARPEAKAEPAPAQDAEATPEAAPAREPASTNAGEGQPPRQVPASLAEPSEFAELLAPDAIEDWDPASPAPAPGKVPPGDSRSFRRTRDGVEEFVLIYRAASFLITRSGEVGTMGTWKVVEYPHIGSAANAYAHRCSDYTAQGFRDFY